MGYWSGNVLCKNFNVLDNVFLYLIVSCVNDSLVSVWRRNFNFVIRNNGYMYIMFFVI